MRKLLFKIHSFFINLFWGFRRADKTLLSSGDITVRDIEINKKQEEDSLWQDLIKGEVTERVIECRHEYYQAIKNSDQYIHDGGGNATKAINHIGKKLPNVLQHKNYILDLLQEQKFVSEANNELENATFDEKFKSIISIKYKDISRYNIEERLCKIVLFKSKKKHIIDLYIPSYQRQFSPKDGFLLNELKKILVNNTIKKDDIFSNIKEIEFLTQNAWNESDLKYFKAVNITPVKISEYNGDFVITTECDFEKYKEDVSQMFYSEKTAEKQKTHTARENNGANIGFNTVIEKEKESLLSGKEMDLIKTLTKN